MNLNKWMAQQDVKEIIGRQNLFRDIREVVDSHLIRVTLLFFSNF